MGQDSLEDYLRQKYIPEEYTNPLKVEILSGGLANFLWRVTTANGVFVVKNYANQLRAIPSVAIISVFDKFSCPESQRQELAVNVQQGWSHINNKIKFGDLLSASILIDITNQKMC